ncbi:MAG: thioredoxin family protein [Rikenellaceae bacterium]|nr:thioredoxin family protein [Rikenellaceae bacterium]
MLEFGHAKELPEELNTDVAFINICLDSHIESWKKIINTHRPAGENFFLNKSNGTIFKDNYDVYSYPNYFIIDKNGRTHPAARPSHQEKLVDELTNHINKQ